MADVQEDLAATADGPSPAGPAAADRRARWTLVGIACWLVLAGGAWLTISRFFGITKPVFTVAGQALTPLAYLAVWPVVGIALWRRRWVMTGLAVALVVVHVAVVLPAVWPRSTPSWAADAPRLRVMTANVKIDNPVDDEAARALVDVDADVLVVVELTPDFVDVLRAQGVRTRYPYRIERTSRWDGRGIGIYSRLPFDELPAIEIGGRQAPGARVQLPSGGHVDVYGIHTVAPFEPVREGRWRDNLATLRSALPGLPRPFVVTGDFNASRWHPPFGAILDDGVVTDAHEQTGNGLSFSWPADRTLIPRLFRLDHALMSDGVTAVGLREVDIPGSDHSGFVAELAIRPA